MSLARGRGTSSSISPRRDVSLRDVVSSRPEPYVRASPGWLSLFSRSRHSRASRSVQLPRLAVQRFDLLISISDVRSSTGSHRFRIDPTVFRLSRKSGRRIYRPDPYPYPYSYRYSYYAPQTRPRTDRDVLRHASSVDSQITPGDGSGSALR